MNQNQGCSTVLLWCAVGAFLFWLANGSPPAKRILKEAGRIVRQLGSQLEDNGREGQEMNKAPPQNREGFIGEEDQSQAGEPFRGRRR